MRRVEGPKDLGREVGKGLGQKAVDVSGVDLKDAGVGGLSLVEGPQDLEDVRVDGQRRRAMDPVLEGGVELDPEVCGQILVLKIASSCYRLFF